MARRKTQEEYIEQLKSVWGDEYDFSESIYLGNKVKIKVICRQHGEFWARPNDLMMGHGCPVCRYIKSHSKTRKTTEQFISDARKIHGDKYDYSKTKYIQAHEKVCITCKMHGDFYQEPNVHLKGFGCPSCSESHLENEMRDFLEKHNIAFVREKTFPWLKNGLNLRVDFFIENKNIAIECQGRQHFYPVKYFGGKESLEKSQYRDIQKQKLCEENGIKVIYYCKKEDFVETKPYNDTNIFFEKDELLKQII